MMNRFRDLMALMRWQNVLMTAIVVYVMEKWVATPLLCSAYFGGQLPWYVLLLLILATCLIAAGGYVINDYFDVKIDAINCPDRLIVTRGVSKQEAMRFYWILTSVGIVCGIVAAWLVRSWAVGIIFVFVPGLLWFYSASYKRLFLVGNLIIAVVSGLTPLLVALSNVSLLHVRFGAAMEFTTVPHDLYMWLGGFAAFAFLGTLIREIIKDIQDQMGDRELECHSLPVVLGETPAKIIVTVLLLLMAAAVVWLAWGVIPFPHGWTTLNDRYVVLGLLVPLLCTLVLLWRAKISSEYKTAQLVMKFVLLMGTLYSFVISHLL